MRKQTYIRTLLKQVITDWVRMTLKGEKCTVNLRSHHFNHLTGIPAMFAGARVSTTSGNHVTGVATASAQNSNGKYVALLLLIDTLRSSGHIGNHDVVLLVSKR